MFYDAYQTGPYKVAGAHDPDSKRIMGVIFRPGVWEPNQVYYRRDEDNFDIVIPTVFTGVYFEVAAPGLSGNLEPPWVYEPDEKTQDGTKGLIWRAKPYNLMPPDETIASVSYSANFGVTITNTSNTLIDCQFTINPLTAEAKAAKYFEVYIVATKSNGEIIPLTLRFKVAER